MYAEIVGTLAKICHIKFFSEFFFYLDNVLFFRSKYIKVINPDGKKQTLGMLKD